MWMVLFHDTNPEMVCDRGDGVFPEFLRVADGPGPHGGRRVEQRR
jgi:hypothetical protein